MTRDVIRLVKSHRNVSVFVAVVLVGVLHRAAETTPWADDRVIAADPDWLQWSAPVWHSTLAGAFTFGRALIRVIDPVTAASTAGDTRAIAAVITSLAALLMLLGFRRLAVPHIAAIGLCFGLVVPTLPTSPATEITHALQILTTTGLLLAWCAPVDVTWRLPACAVLTLVGASNHVGFVPFAAGLWIAESTWAPAARRLVTATLAATVIVSALAIGAYVLQRVAIQATPRDRAMPSVADVAIALVTGRFSDQTQPGRQGALSVATQQGIPAPWILSIPIAALALLDRRHRRVTGGLIASAGCVVVFSATTWMPDLAIASAPARIAFLVLVGRGVSWLWAEPTRGAKPLGVLAVGFLVTAPFVARGNGAARVATADLESFASSASSFVGDGFWSADRLSTTRALLARGVSPLLSRRVEANVRGFARAPRGARLIAFSGLSRQEIAPGLWILPQELPHTSAATYVAAQPDTRWLAIALSGSPPEGFCRALLNEIQLYDRTSPGVGVVAHAHGRELLAAQGDFDLPYGGEDDGLTFRSPAHFTIESDRRAAITINGRRIGPISDGMVLATFDTDTVLVRGWTVGSCAKPSIPPIEDRRLRATYVLETNGAATLPAVPIVSKEPVEVTFDANGGSWFGEGWNAPEGPGVEPFRWTGAIDANVHVVVSQQQSLEVHLSARLVEQATQKNTLAVLWNGAMVAPLAGGEIDADWTIPAALVRRGANILTLRVAAVASPAESGQSLDKRVLGAAVRRISIVPIGSSKGAGSTTSPR